jgi:hypothetical protein
MGGVIEETLNYLASLPSWVDRLGSVLGIVAFTFPLVLIGVKNLSKLAAYAIDRASLWSKRYAMWRAVDLSRETRVWIFAAKSGSRGFSAYIAYKILHTLALCISGTIGSFLAAVLTIENMNVRHISIVIILCLLMSIYFVSQRAFEFLRMSNKIGHAYSALERLHRFLYRAGLKTYEAREAWLKEQKIIGEMGIDPLVVEAVKNDGSIIPANKAPN